MTLRGIRGPRRFHKRTPSCDDGAADFTIRALLYLSRRQHSRIRELNRLARDWLSQFEERDVVLIARSGTSTRVLDDFEDADFMGRFEIRRTVENNQRLLRRDGLFSAIPNREHPLRSHQHAIAEEPVAPFPGLLRHANRHARWIHVLWRRENGVQAFDFSFAILSRHAGWFGLALSGLCERRCGAKSS